MPIYTATTSHAKNFRDDQAPGEKVLTAAYLSVHVYPSSVLQFKPLFMSPLLDLMFVTNTSLPYRFLFFRSQNSYFEVSTLPWLIFETYVLFLAYDKLHPRF